MKARQVASVIFLVVILGIGVYYIVSHQDRFALVLRIPWWGFGALAALALLRWSLSAVVLRITLKELGAALGFLESHLLIWTLRYWNYLPMKPGIYALAVYLKRARSLPYSGFLVYLLAVNLISALCRGIVGFVLATVICLMRNVTLLLPAVFGAIVVGSSGLMLVPRVGNYPGANWLLRRISQATQAWHQIRTRRPVLLRIALLETAQLSVGITYMALCFQLVGIGNSVAQALVAVLLAPVVSVVALVPGNLGLNEAVIGAVAVAFGGSFTDGVVAATLGRAVTFVLLVVLGPVSSHKVLTHFVPSPSQPTASLRPSSKAGS